MNNIQHLFWLAVATLLLIILEKIFPLRIPKHKYLPRLTINFLMSILLYSTALLTVKPLSQLGIVITSESNIGLLNLFNEWNNLTPGIRYLVGFLLMDLSFYYWHLLNHKVGWFWRFHVVHHIDPDLDVSTSFRFHFVEVAYSMFFRFLQVLIIGVPLDLYVMYEYVFQIMTFFHHSNLRLPAKLDQMLNWIIVTPRMHGIHHSVLRAETNSNFSVVFSFWDRWHRTFVAKTRSQLIEIGVPGYSAPVDNSFESLILLPFKKQKAYWPSSDKS